MAPLKNTLKDSLKRLVAADCQGTPTDRRNQWRIIAWALAWAVAYLAVTAGLRSGVVEGRAMSLAGVALCGALGLGTFMAYRRFLIEADELRRKIELEALAAAFGVGVFGGLTYWLLALAGLVSEADVSAIVVLMILTHSVGTVLGLRRYS